VVWGGVGQGRAGLGDVGWAGQGVVVHVAQVGLVRSASITHSWCIHPSRTRCPASSCTCCWYCTLCCSLAASNLAAALLLLLLLPTARILCLLPCSERRYLGVYCAHLEALDAVIRLSEYHLPPADMHEVLYCVPTAFSAPAPKRHCPQLADPAWVERLARGLAYLAQVIPVWGRWVC